MDEMYWLLITALVPARDSMDYPVTPDAMLAPFQMLNRFFGRLPKPIHSVELRCGHGLKWSASRRSKRKPLGNFGSHTCVLVRCPRTGNPIACLRPRYEPMSLSLLIFSCSFLLKSFSIVIFESSAVRSSACLSTRLPIIAVG